MPRRNLDRYHRDVLFPQWYETSLNIFIRAVRSHGSITFSLHALEKTIEYSFEYGRTMFKFLLRSVRRNSLDPNSVFEFYASDEEIHRACFRYSFEEFPVDLVLVISADGVVVTVFVINKTDNHTTLNRNLYVRK